MKAIMPIDVIERKIYLIRGKKVMLDSDLAELYGVQTKVLNKAVARNEDRFPEDFMFALSAEEYDSLRFQIGTLKKGRGQHRKYLREQGGVQNNAETMSAPRGLRVFLTS